MSSACEMELTKLERFRDGELGGAERREVEDHLGACTSCQARLQAVRLSGELLRDHLERKAAEADFSHFEDRVFAAIAAAPPVGPLARLGLWFRESFASRRAAWVATAATAAVFLAILLPLLGREKPAVDRPAPAADQTRLAQADDVDNEVIIDSIEYAGERSMIFTVSKNNTTVIWMTDFDRRGAKETQGDDI